MDGNSYATTLHTEIYDFLYELIYKLLPFADDGLSRSAKRARFYAEESDEDSEMGEDLLDIHHNDSCFEDLCGDANFAEDSSSICGTENESWGLLDGHILARVFHFLRADMKSLLSSAFTCKHWNSAANFYKSISRCVDLSSAGLKCSDLMFQSVMVCPLFFAVFLFFIYNMQICKDYMHTLQSWYYTHALE